MKAVILAAGIGSRLGHPYPKPLTVLKNGKAILEQQIGNLSALIRIHDIYIVVGFKKEMLMERFPDAAFIYNEKFDTTNTSKSLLKALYKFTGEDVLWLNGDVVFDGALFDVLKDPVRQQRSFVCVNNSAVGEEEVKYSVDTEGFIDKISKQVNPALGEAVGINFIAGKDMPALIRQLEACTDDDYFEKGLEMAIEKNGLRILPIHIEDYLCMEIDFREDLNRVNALLDGTNIS
ncbi:phosphocholine cytidylyltransferase family protein [bacterium]|nr:phosphocholine cytidylyltransferase family protein [bacterium]